MITKEKMERYGAIESYIIILVDRKNFEIQNSGKKRCKGALETQRQIDQLMDEKKEIERELERIPNLRIRTALIMKYKYRYSWKTIAQKIGMGDTEDSIRIAVERFFRKGE